MKTLTENHRNFNRVFSLETRSLDRPDKNFQQPKNHNLKFNFPKTFLMNHKRSCVFPRTR